jgi:hypothetical protein
VDHLAGWKSLISGADGIERRAFLELPLLWHQATSGEITKKRENEDRKEGEEEAECNEENIQMDGGRGSFIIKKEGLGLFNTQVNRRTFEGL